MVTTRLCFCEDRIRSMTFGTFKWSYPHRAWFATDIPTRSMSQLASYYAFVERGLEYPHEDHRGEYYYYVDCPWCGNSLPGTLEEHDPGPFSRGDGGDGAE